MRIKHKYAVQIYTSTAGNNMVLIPAFLRYTISGGFRGGSSRLQPLGDGLTQSLTVMLAIAKFFLSFYCKTWYSKYSK